MSVPVTGGACAVEAGVPHFIFSVTAAVYGEPEQSSAAEDARYGHIAAWQLEVDDRDNTHQDGASASVALRGLAELQRRRG